MLESMFDLPWLRQAGAMLGLQLRPMWHWLAASAALLVILCLTWRYIQAQRRKNYCQSLQRLQSMPWQEFELLTRDFLRSRGYGVTRKGGAKADGGIDLLAQRGGKRYLVQCKRYKSAVGVSVVREMYGVMHGMRLDGVIIAASGSFTKSAWEFAQGKPIQLIGGKAIMLAMRKN